MVTNLTFTPKIEITTLEGTKLSAFKREHLNAIEKKIQELLTKSFSSNWASTPCTNKLVLRRDNQVVQEIQLLDTDTDVGNLMSLLKDAQTEYVHYTTLQATAKAEFLNDKAINRPDDIVEKIDKLGPWTDTVGMYRNGTCLIFTCISLLYLILGAAAISTPASIIIVGLACLAGLGILVGLRLAGKINNNELAFLAGTIILLFSLYTFCPIGAKIFTILYSVFRLYQGVTNIKVGLAYYKNGNDKEELSQKLGDDLNSSGFVSGKYSGGTTIASGAFWCLFSSLVISQTIAALLGVDSIIFDKVCDAVGDSFFFIVFNLGYIVSLVAGIKDYHLHLAYQEKLKTILGDKYEHLDTLNKDTCLKFLNSFREQLLGIEKDSATLSQDDNANNLRLQKKLYEFNKYLDTADVELLKLNNIDYLIQQIKIGDAAALQKAQDLIYDIVETNQRNIEYSKANMWINTACLVVGIFINIMELEASGDTILGGDLLKPEHPDAAQALSSAFMIGDCSFWVLWNYFFRTYLDDPLGRRGDDLEHRIKSVDPVEKTIAPTERSPKQIRYNALKAYLESHVPEQVADQVEIQKNIPQASS